MANVLEWVNVNKWKFNRDIIYQDMEWSSESFSLLPLGYGC